METAPANCTRSPTCHQTVPEVPPPTAGACEDEERPWVTSCHGKSLHSGARLGRSLALLRGTLHRRGDRRDSVFFILPFISPLLSFFCSPSCVPMMVGCRAVLVSVPRHCSACPCLGLSPGGHVSSGGSGWPRNSSAMEASAPHWEWTNVPRRFTIYFYNDKP